MIPRDARNETLGDGRPARHHARRSAARDSRGANGRLPRLHPESSGDVTCPEIAQGASGEQDMVHGRPGLPDCNAIRSRERRATTSTADSSMPSEVRPATITVPSSAAATCRSRRSLTSHRDDGLDHYWLVTRVPSRRTDPVAPTPSFVLLAFQGRQSHLTASTSVGRTAQLARSEELARPAGCASRALNGRTCTEREGSCYGGFRSALGNV